MSAAHLEPLVQSRWQVPVSLAYTPRMKRPAAGVIALLALAGVTLSASSGIRVNLVGYRPGDTKVATGFGIPAGAAFRVVDAASRASAYEGTAQAAPVSTWGALSPHVELDFSAVRRPGRYYLEVGAGKPEPAVTSPAFDVADDLYGRLANVLLEFMRQQRCGYNPFLDAVCHRFDARTAEGHVPDGSFLEAHGGWHDAGDTLKYLITTSNAAAQLLLAYRLAPSAFTDEFNALGQAGGNGIADVLDEARWGLDWMLRLHPAPDALYHQLADDRDHSGWRLPQDDQSDYGWGKGSYRVVYGATGKPQGLGKYKSEATGIANLAGRYAAAMALAYQVWRDDPAGRAYAQRCLRAGIEVYAMGKTREGYQQGNSYGAPYRYNETTWADDMEWGAAELYRATRQAGYLADARRYAALAGTESWIGHAEIAHYRFYPFMNAGHYRLASIGGPKTSRRLAGYYREGLDATIKASLSSAYRVGVPFIWCSNNLVVALATQGLMYERMTGDARYRAFALAQRDWLFGRNPWGTSMFTGIPENGVFPTDTHIPVTQLTGRSVRGGLVDGPVAESIFKGLRGVTLSRPDRFAPFQAAEAVYHDDWADYSTNEPTMDGTASAVLLMALMAADQAAPVPR